MDMRPSQNQRNSSLSIELFDILGEDAFLRFVEVFGGQRRFVPVAISSESEVFAEMAGVIGEALASKVFAAYNGSYIRVPIARTFRIVKYHEAGLSHRQIASKLLIVETSVDKVLAEYHLLARLDRVELVGAGVRKKAREARLARIVKKVA